MSHARTAPPVRGGFAPAASPSQPPAPQPRTQRADRRARDCVVAGDARAHSAAPFRMTSAPLRFRFASHPPTPNILFFLRPPRFGGKREWMGMEKWAVEKERGSGGDDPHSDSLCVFGRIKWSFGIQILLNVYLSEELGAGSILFPLRRTKGPAARECGPLRERQRRRVEREHGERGERPEGERRRQQEPANKKPHKKRMWAVKRGREKERKRVCDKQRVARGQKETTPAPFEQKTP
ncbi:unnamed protein product [Bursaphelenchus xylophilus]|nr:unnamed protein product [Bursaphelenchus xylophilus]CAG9089113.1 unnamed protein product [Bursaphelenchus xylophilus]